MAERTILFATDYSDASQYALSYACSLARDLDALLLITHVSEHEYYPVGEAVHEEPEPSPQDVEQLRSVRPATQDVRFEHRLLYAQPTSQTIRLADEIIKFADSVGVYAIVAGTHGRTGFKRTLMGSTAEMLVRHANCPVVCVRCPGKLEKANRRGVTAPGYPVAFTGEQKI
jgi:nucleotide-binding universal stress UspA family protein